MIRITKKEYGFMMLFLSASLFAIIMQLAKVSYYSYLATQVADFNKTESEFVSQPALVIVIICSLISIYLIFSKTENGEKIHEKKNH
ncbi:hypothetical protein [Amedibacillus sp. YH-ame10]